MRLIRSLRVTITTVREIVKVMIVMMFRNATVTIICTIISLNFMITNLVQFKKHIYVIVIVIISALDAVSHIGVRWLGWCAHASRRISGIGCTQCTCHGVWSRGWGTDSLSTWYLIIRHWITHIVIVVLAFVATTTTIPSFVLVCVFIRVCVLCCYHVIYITLL